MITRKSLHFGAAIRFSWKNLLYSGVMATVALIIHRIYVSDYVSIPPSVVAILGTALAIIMAFRNAAAYERWWSARSYWASIASESRTFTR